MIFVAFELAYSYSPPQSVTVLKTNSLTTLKAVKIIIVGATEEGRMDLYLPKRPILREQSLFDLSGRSLKNSILKA